MVTLPLYIETLDPRGYMGSFRRELVRTLNLTLSYVNCGINQYIFSSYEKYNYSYASSSLNTSIKIPYATMLMIVQYVFLGTDNIHNDAKLSWCNNNIQFKGKPFKGAIQGVWGAGEVGKHFGQLSLWCCRHYTMC